MQAILCWLEDRLHFAERQSCERLEQLLMQICRNQAHGPAAVAVKPRREGPLEKAEIAP